jgi:hypothetical protein
MEFCYALVELTGERHGKCHAYRLMHCFYYIYFV